MIHRTLVLSLLLCLGLAAMAQKAPAHTGGPYLEIDKMIHDHGTLKKGANGDAYFTITNTGDQPLHITRCESNCGCTVAQCPDQPIPPGASYRMKVHYDTERTGRINHAVTVFTNATNARQMQVLLQGMVKE